MGILAQLIDAAKASTVEAGAARIAEIRAKLTEAIEGGAEVDLDAIESEAIAEFDKLHKGDDFSPEVVAGMAAIADVCDAVRGHRADSEAQAEATAQQVADLAARMQADSSAGEGTEGDATGGTDGGAGAGTEGGDGGAADGAAEPRLPATAAASARTAPRVPMRSINKGNTPPAAKQGGRATSYKTMAAAEIPSVAPGSDLDIAGVANAAQHRLHALARAGTGKLQAGIATIKRELPADLTLNSFEDTNGVLERATREQALPGGTLVAAGGWCAPSETLYDLCEDDSAVDGIVDIATMNATRGGVRWPSVPDFAALYRDANATFYMDEATVQAGATDKPIYEIACNTFSEVRLGVAGLGVKTPILTERAYPELVKFTIGKLLTAHAHHVNARKIAQMKALSTAKAIPYSATANYGPGATMTALSMVELYVEYLRTKRRMALTATMEMVAPHWLRPVLRSDLGKRYGGDLELLGVTNAQLDAWFTLRGVNVQWVADYQDTYAQGGDPATGFGGTTLPTAWPRTCEVMIYPAGTFFCAQSDVISIDGLYDSALLVKNMHLSMFTEEGFVVGKRCYESIALTFPIDPTGLTAGAGTVDVTAGAV